MFLIRFFRFLTGYIVFTGAKGFPERFINLCSKNGITLWDVKCVNGILTAKTGIKSYKKIRKSAHGSGMMLKIKEKCGVPFILHSYRYRKGILAGIALSAVLIFLMTSTVWVIDVEGNHRFTKEQILSIAEEYGIKKGVFKKSIDIINTQEKVKSTVDGISWMSVNIEGSRASIIVSESKIKPEMYLSTSPCNILASCDGELIKLEVYEGTAASKIGCAITKGDLLIGGIKEKTDGSVTFCHARGKAVIRTNRQINAEIGKTSFKAVKNQAYRYSLYFFGLTIPLGRSDSANEYCRTESYLDYNTTILPAGIIKDRYTSFENMEITLDNTQKTLLCGYSFFCSEFKMMKNAETESKKITVSQKDNTVSVSGKYVNSESTVTEQEFEVDSNGAISYF